jgi:membrane dipeptidase
MPLLFDSHLDLAWNALSWKRDLLLPLHELNRLDALTDDHPARGRATVCLPEMRRGRVAVCLATLMGRVPYGSAHAAHGGTLDFPRHENVFAFAQGHLAYYRILTDRGHLRPIVDRHTLEQHWRQWLTASDEDQEGAPPLGVIIAMEGSDAICEPEQAELWRDAGLRCASLVHYGSSRYASGTGDEGPVTADGRELLDQFARLGIILDTTHLCDTSFFQALDHFPGPVLASHQNCRRLVPGQRQFSDEQLRLLFGRGGVVGVAFDAWMMYPGWERGRSSREVVSLAAAVDQIDHLCQLAGTDTQVAIGSDLDGGFGTEQTPTGLDSIADLQHLAPLLADRGYADDQIERIFGRNWLRFFSEHLPAHQA